MSQDGLGYVHTVEGWCIVRDAFDGIEVWCGWRHGWVHPGSGSCARVDPGLLGQGSTGASRRRARSHALMAGSLASLPVRRHALAGSPHRASFIRGRDLSLLSSPRSRRVAHRLV